MKKKIFAIGLAGLTVASMGVASAFPNFLRDNEEIQSAIDTADYNEFITELEQVNPVMAENMNEFRFERMQEQNDRMQAVEDNDYEAWLATFPENSKVSHSEEDFNAMVERQLNHDLIEEALEEGDYEAWKSLVEKYDYGRGMSNIVSEEDFNNMREVHELMEDGDFEAAHDLARELGMGQKQGRGSGNCMGDGNFGSQKMSGARGQGMHRY